jgi:hypothetical protein
MEFFRPSVGPGAGKLPTGDPRCPIPIVPSAHQSHLFSRVPASVSLSADPDYGTSRPSTGDLGSSGALPTSAESRSSAMARQKELYNKRRNDVVTGGMCTQVFCCLPCELLVPTPWFLISCVDDCCDAKKACIKACVPWMAPVALRITHQQFLSSQRRAHLATPLGTFRAGDGLGVRWR